MDHVCPMSDHKFQIVEVGRFYNNHWWWNCVWEGNNHCCVWGWHTTGVDDALLKLTGSMLASPFNFLVGEFSVLVLWCLSLWSYERLEDNYH